MIVVVTRPIGQADKLANALRAEQFTPAIFPLLDIEPTDDPADLQAALAQLAQFDCVVFVSPNALAHALTPAHLRAAACSIWPNHLPIAVMGPGSVTAVQAFAGAHPQFMTSPDIIAPQSRFDSETLYQDLSARFGSLQGKRFLIVRGNSGREWLADTLRADGADVTLVEAYQRHAPKLNTVRYVALLRLLQQNTGEAVIWTITSSESVRHFVDLIRQICWGEPELDFNQLQATMQLYMPHGRIVEVARAAGFQNCTLTEAGDEGLLAALCATR
ncbi:uroporphyrinogen-III synthase [Ampullimonas aquatilis]|uniref:uroporphyrinogen-III synthase n=1 Tax=Ampullimonas aquatilis TaxID=1341549 RepID=UPI003C70E70D